MDHPCHKCGHSIEDGKPFCSQCGAPQIRVAVPETFAEATPQADGGARAFDREVGSSASGIPVGSLPPVSGAQRLATVRSRGRGRGRAYSPRAESVCGGARRRISGGCFFSASRARNLVRGGSGAGLAPSAASCFSRMSTVLETLAVALLHKGAEIRSQMLEKVQQAAARYPGPEVQPFLDFVKTPDGFAFMMVASVIFGLLAFVVLGSCGGALGAALLGRRDRP